MKNVRRLQAAELLFEHKTLNVQMDSGRWLMSLHFEL